MKRFIASGIISGFILLLCSGIAVAQQKTVPLPPPPPPPKTTKTEKHIKMVKIDNDGKKTELDTVITGNAPFVWNGDTINGGKNYKWMTRDEFTMDSVHKFDYKIEGDGKGKMIMIHSGKGDPMIWTEGMPGVPPPPHAPKVMMIRHQQGKNIIDLSDPGIISYDKKIQKDGTEKITIVRKQVPAKEEIEGDVLIHAPGAPGEFHINQSAPGAIKTVRVIKSDDGTTRVIEDENVIHMEGKDGITKFVGDDGKVIIVKEMKEGDQKKVEVTVEEEKKAVQEKK
jgi:hypothetical protein